MVVSNWLLGHSIYMTYYNVDINMASYSGKLAQRFRILRERTGLSQEVVAHRAGLSTYTYQKFEKGESSPGNPMNPRLNTLLALCDVFGITVAELLDFGE